MAMRMYASTSSSMTRFMGQCKYAILYRNASTVSSASPSSSSRTMGSLFQRAFRASSPSSSHITSSNPWLCATVWALPSHSPLNTLNTLVRTYHKNVLDHYENPRNVGSLDKTSPDVGTGLVGAPACGDVMKLQIRVDENGKIIESKFKTFGCGSAIASSSLATEMIQGKHINDAVQIRNQDIAKELKLPPVKLHCSMLAEDAIKAAVKDLLKKREQNAAKCGHGTGLGNGAGAGITPANGDSERVAAAI
eukprot:CAMPEP_0184695912 /NCGR_PEP_ID=MMETSP0313-20130426/3382_1 /TAXON_ID=2792 /ORGANISM="Porphyridium aerugineum, Strain SAG 1380-2" /LENGTH=249 /DNA_ID=CAMNT_0027154439 /DNA_START=100 /DNA_END=849 /DNA_ORIENTATION=+